MNTPGTTEEIFPLGSGRILSKHANSTADHASRTEIIFYPKCEFSARIPGARNKIEVPLKTVQSLLYIRNSLGNIEHEDTASETAIQKKMILYFENGYKAL